MHFGDYTFIFLLALVLFGPKKLPEIGRQLGKLLAEFRRASNEFKYQIQEELRNMEDDERRKKLAEEQAARAAIATATPETLASATAETQATPSILPPSTGTQVSTSKPYATVVEPYEPVPDPDINAVPEEPPAPSEMAVAPEAGGDSLLPLDRTTEESTPGNGVYSPAPESLTHAGESVPHA